jgi:hypothetical protein
MAEPGWPRHALGIGVFEFRRSVRELWDDKARFAFMLIGLLLPAVVVTGLVVLFADAIRGVGAMAVHDAIRGMIALFWLFGVFVIGQRVVSARIRIEADSLMLTTVSARTVAGGLLVAETLRLLTYVALPTLVLTGVGVFLLGSLASLVLVPTVVLLFTTTVVITGSVVGYAAAWLVATSRFVARHKAVLGTAASLLGMGGYFLFLYPQISGVSQAALAWFPMGWLVDLAAVGTRFVGAPLRAAGVVLGSAGLLVGGGVIVECETAALWFTEPVSPDTEKDEAEPTPDTETAPHASPGDALAAAVKPLVVPRVVSAPVRGVAERVLLRTRRDPNRLLFLMIPVFAVGSPLVSVGVESGSIGALAAPLAAVAVPWLAGALFAMNPLGDEGAVLPVTLTAVSGRQYIRGLIAPGLVFGLPLVLVATVIAGLLSPYTLVEQLGLVALGLYLTAVAVTITPAIGMALPRFSAISVGQSRNVLPPRMSAVAVHAAVTVLPGALLAALLLVPSAARAVLAGVFGFLPAFLLELIAGSDGGVLTGVTEWFAGLGNGIQAVGLTQLRSVAGGALLFGGVLVSILLYRNAIHRFERYAPR